MVPGNTVERSTSKLAVGKRGSSASTQSWTTLRTGLRNSSIGVPMVMITGPSPEMRSDELVKNEAVVGQRLGSAAFSRAVLDEWQPAGLQRIQRLPVEIVDIDAQSASASASTSGTPTWPAPPTTVSRRFSMVVGASE